MVENDWLVSYLALQNTGSEEVVWEFEMPPTGTDNIQVFAHSVEFTPEQGHDVTWVKKSSFLMKGKIIKKFRIFALMIRAKNFQLRRRQILPKIRKIQQLKSKL